MYVATSSQPHKVISLDSDRSQNITKISLPLEIVENIIEEIWLSAIGPDSRPHVATSLRLVSSIWHFVMSRITSTYIYFTERSHHQYLFERISRSTTEVSSSDKSIHQRCRRITRQLRISASYPRYLADTQWMSRLLSTFQKTPYLPNLENLTVEYWDGSRHYLTRNLPVIQMDVEYSFDAQKLSLSLYKNISTGYDRPCRSKSWYAPVTECVSVPMRDRDRALHSVLQNCPDHEVNGTDSSVFARVLGASRAIPLGLAIVLGPVEAECDSAEYSYDLEFGCDVLRRRVMGLIVETRGSNEPSPQWVYEERMVYQLMSISQGFG